MLIKITIKSWLVCYFSTKKIFAVTTSTAKISTFLSFHIIVGCSRLWTSFTLDFFLHTSQLTEHYCSTVSAFYGLVVLLALSFNQKLTWFRYILGNFPFFTAKINGIGTSSTYLQIGNPCNLIIFIIEAILEYYINTFSINNSR